MNKAFELTNKKIWVAGHSGLVGAAMCRHLAGEECDILTVSRDDLDLRDQAATYHWIDKNKPDAIILAAAKVGGIEANRTQLADFMVDNLRIQINVIEAAQQCGVQKLLFLGSSCMYPSHSPQPLRIEDILNGAPEPTNAAYAMAKRAGMELCTAMRSQYDFDCITAIPCNLYGPGDRYDPLNSHVIPALIEKIHHAKQAKQTQVTLWGTGTPLREFLYVDDLAEALVKLLKTYSDETPVNVGSGQEISIEGLAGLIAKIIGYDGEVLFDPTMPNGSLRKVMYSSLMLAMGWLPRTDLKTGLRLAYQDYLSRR